MAPAPEGQLSVTGHLSLPDGRLVPCASKPGTEAEASVMEQHILVWETKVMYVRWSLGLPWRSHPWVLPCGITMSCSLQGWQFWRGGRGAGSVQGQRLMGVAPGAAPQVPAAM